MNKRVLLVCYYFPPMGMGGIGRPLNLFHHLPEFGYDCDILTVKPVAYRSFEPELLEGLNLSKIYRAGSYDPQRILYLLGKRTVKASSIKSTRKLSERFFPDSKVGWVSPAIRKGKRLINNKKKYDCIISTAPPVSVHLVAKELSERYSIPWIADFRDYWTAFKIEDSFTNPQMIAKGKKLLCEIKEKASVCSSVNHTISDYLGSAEIIYNGYKSSLAGGWEKFPTGDMFTIGLLGHQLESFEVITLLDLLVSVREKYPDDFKKLQIIQVGQLDKEWLESLLVERKLEIQVICHGQKPRAETIDILSECHLFYFGINVSGSTDFLPGKTFDLLASGRPIIINAPDKGEIWRVLSKSDKSHFMSNDKLNLTVEYLHKLIMAQSSGELVISPLSEYAKGFSSEQVAANFASLINRLTKA